DFIAQHRDWQITPAGWARTEHAIPALKQRAKTLAELADQARFLLAERPISPDDKAKAQLTPETKARLLRLRERLTTEKTWESAALAASLKAFAADEGVGLGQIGPGLRAALTGSTVSPELGQVLEFLGKDESLARLADIQ